MTFLRVLLATPSYFPVIGGSETLTRAIAAELNRAGIQADIMAFNMDEKWSPIWHEKTESDGDFKVFKVAGINPFSFLRWKPLYFTLGIVVLPKLDFRKRFIDYDIIHFLGEADLSMSFFSRSVKKPKIVQCFNPAYLDSQLQKHKMMRRLFARVFPKLADLYIVFAPEEKKTLSAWGVARNRIRIWHYGVDTDFFRPDETRRLDNLVLFVGRIDMHKGLHVLLRSLSWVKTRAHVAIIGPPAGSEYLQELRRMCLETNEKGFHTVEFLGAMNQHDLVPWYQKAAVLARPDLTGASGEGCSTMEALACGTPVIGVQNHVVRNDIDGLIVEPNKPEKLAEALNKMLGDKELRKRYGREGRRIVEESFSLKSSVKELARIYEDALCYSLA